MDEDRDRRHPESIALAFPPDVWRAIADHMTIREWARVSGTCKTTWNLQLDEVYLWSRETAAGAAWLLRRAHEARRLTLELFQVDVKDPSTAVSKLVNSTGSWENLRGMKMWQWDPVAPESQNVVLSILVQATKLEFLSLSLEKQPCVFSCLQNLKHLQLTLHDDDFCEIAPELAVLNRLQTLFLAYDDNGEWNSQERAALDLSGLGMLQSLSLSNVVPAALKMPKGAKLHLQMSFVSSLKEEVWAEHAPVLESVYLCGVKGESIQSASELPGLLVEPSGLKHITLHLDAFKMDGGPLLLSGSFLKVESLVLQCLRDLSVRVPSRKLPWQLASFACSGSVEIVFDNVGNFLSSCQDFHIAYGSLVGVDVFQLCQGIAQHGLKCGSHSHFDTDIQRRLFEIYTISAPAYVSDYTVKRDFNAACQCGACPQCSAGGSCGRDGVFKF